MSSQLQRGAFGMHGYALSRELPAESGLGVHVDVRRPALANQLLRVRRTLCERVRRARKHATPDINISEPVGER